MPIRAYTEVFTARFKLNSILYRLSVSKYLFSRISIEYRHSHVRLHDDEDQQKILNS